MAEEYAQPNDLDDEEAMASYQSARKRRWEATKACIQVIVFFTFLLLFSLVVLLECQPYERYLQQTITDHFKAAHNAKVRPDEVDSYEKFWDYMQNGLVIGLYGNASDIQGRPTAIEKLQSMGGDEFKSNTILGAVLVRQLKVKEDTKESCNLGAYGDFFQKCYLEYSPENELTAGYGPANKLFEYTFDVTTPHPGEFADYGSGGFTELITANRSFTGEKLRNLRDGDWLGISTRAIIVDFNTWNPNLELYAVVRLMWESSPIGVWNYDVRVLLLKPRYLTAFGAGSSGEWIMTICEASIALFCLYYIAEEISELWVSFGEYVQDGWNLIDWATLILLLYWFMLRIGNYTEACAPKQLYHALKGVVPAQEAPIQCPPGINEMDDYNIYTDLQMYAERMYDVRKVNAFNSVLIWTKIVKYIPFLPYSRVLKELFSSSGALFLSFIVVFIIFFVGFGLAFCVGFGMENEQLATWPITWVYLGRSLLGDVNVTEIYRYAPIAGSMMLGLFVVGVYMVLLNMWYALILFAFSQTREQILEKKEAKDEKPLLEVFLSEAKATFKESVDTERLLRKYTPGLHARTTEKWRRAEAKVLRRKDKRIALEQERTRNQQLDRAKSSWSLMPFNRTLEGGQELNRPGSLLGIGDSHLKEEVVEVKAAGAQGEAASDVSDESLDLGPLSPTKVHAQKKWKKRMGLEAEIKPPLEDLESAVSSLGTQILDRVRHIGREVKDEMEETKEVLAGIKDVIQVVNRRVKDLDIVQKQHL